MVVMEGLTVDPVSRYGSKFLVKLLLDLFCGVSCGDEDLDLLDVAEGG